MTADELFNDVVALLNHKRSEIYSEYGTQISLTIADRIIETVLKEGVHPTSTGCEEAILAYQERIKEKGTELKQLLKVHNHSKDIQDTAIHISKSMSGTLGHNKQSLVLSCGGEEYGDLSREGYSKPLRL